jgi:hypothetical protein
MVVADDQLDAVEASFLQSTEKLPPMHFCLAQGDTHTQQATVPLGSDSHGDDHRDAFAADSKSRRKVRRAEGELCNTAFIELHRLFDVKEDSS